MFDETSFSLPDETVFSKIWTNCVFILINFTILLNFTNYCLLLFYKRYVQMIEYILNFLIKAGCKYFFTKIFHADKFFMKTEVERLYAAKCLNFLC